MTISEAAQVEAAAQQAAADTAARIAEVRRRAEADAQARRTADAEAQAETLAARDASAGVSPMAVPVSLVPQPRPQPVVQRYAALREAAREREARRAAEQQAAAQVQTAAAQPRRAGGDSRGGLCGVPGLTGRSLPRVTSSTRGCGIEEPVSVTSVQGIPLSMAATLDCTTATALDTWIRSQALPALGNAGGGVAQIRVAAHYACRPRNNQSGARISEHGRGRAIDIAGFRLRNGETITVLEDFRRGSQRRAMQRMYEGACGIFGTTLGPNADRFHQDHFHFDTARYRSGSYCR